MWSRSRRRPADVTLPDPEAPFVRCDCLRTHGATAGRDQDKIRPTGLTAATDPAVVPRRAVRR